MMQFSKMQIASVLTAGIASFIVVGQVLHPGHALSLSAAPAATSAAPISVSTNAAPVPMAPRPDAPADDRRGALRGACRQDVQQLCGGVAPGQGRIVRCLAERRSEISEACRSAMIQGRNDRAMRRQADGRPDHGKGQRAGMRFSERADFPRQARRLQSSGNIRPVPDSGPRSE